MSAIQLKVQLSMASMLAILMEAFQSLSVAVVKLTLDVVKLHRQAHSFKLVFIISMNLTHLKDLIIHQKLHNI